MKLSKEDVKKYGTEDEQETLKEIGMKISPGWEPKVKGGKMGEIHPPGSIDRPFHPVRDTGWKEADAFERVSIARSGSLSKDYATYKYLVALRKYIYEWLEEVETAIATYKPKE